MKTITIHRRNIHQGNLILVNQSHPFMNEADSYHIPLIPFQEQRPALLLEIKTAAVLTHLINQIQAQDHIVPISGYRSYEEQKKIYDTSLIENGSSFTKQYVAYPNHSEHQTGLAIDLAFLQEEIDFIRPEFPYDGICKDFRDKAPEHGFVERYQKGKEKVTGIAHEPWHFRYVGYPHALIMEENQLALEEYMELLKSFPYEGEHFMTEIHKQPFEIFYLMASDTLTTLQLQEDSIYQISGNNIDGFVVTLWR